MGSIGPSSRSIDVLMKMIGAGMDIARILLSHMSYHHQAETIHNIRKAAKMYSEQQGFEIPVAIALEMRGAEVRTGTLEGGVMDEVKLTKGELVRLSTNRDYTERGNADTIYVDYDNITLFVKPGTRIFLDHGRIGLIALEVEVNTILCKIENSGLLGSRVSVSVPEVVMDIPPITDRDRSDLKFCVEQKIDFVIVSFARSAELVEHVRQILGEKGKQIKIIAKIETKEGIENLTEIIQAADGIFIGRGHMGVEMPLEKIFLGQKAIISRCNKAGKPVVCGSQLLGSMVKMPRPTRAEVNDVANVVLDGADCLVLTRETAKSHYPVEAIAAVDRICIEAEAALWHHHLFVELIEKLQNLDAANSIGIAAVEAATKSNSTAIIVITTSGKSAFLIAKYKPRVPIIAVTRYSETARQANIYRGIIPLVYHDPPMHDWTKDVDARVQFGLRYGALQGFINNGDSVVIVTGWREGSGFTNTLRIIYAFNTSVSPEKDDETMIHNIVNF
ncbi:unnamed protein product [Hermetia illucens]|uniref:Pyruvate kinase n=2 Tax=Hermetia illucens TaxID=343691 RepID=A0A7R8URW9_HERIL|nr:unnamed protein product [Hermetia illucens]